MSDVDSAGTLAQILANLQTLTTAVGQSSERLAVVETLLRAQHGDHEDHEKRLRSLESTATGLLPRVDYERDRDQRARSRAVWLGILIAALVSVIVPVEAIVLTRMFG